MTLDAGGTNFVFSAIQGNQEAVDPIRYPSNAEDLDHCLETVIKGFQGIKEKLPEPPSAISFCFPGPADFPNGIIGDLVNLPAFRGGVALGPMLEHEFKIPVYINNDGDLFTYGESLAGLLPEINQKLEESGSPKRFKNLLGITLGTGFGGGIVINGKLLEGDNSAGGEVNQLRNLLYPNMTAEEGISIRGIQRFYAENAGIRFDEELTPKTIAGIARGEAQGDQHAAAEAFRMFGRILGDSISNVITLVDGLIVIGGGIVRASDLFIDALLEEMRSEMTDFESTIYPRIKQKTFNLDDPDELSLFIEGNRKLITVPGSGEQITYDAMQRTGVGLRRLRTSTAIAIGAYNYALSNLDT